MKNHQYKIYFLVILAQNCCHFHIYPWLDLLSPLLPSLHEHFFFLQFSSHQEGMFKTLYLDIYLSWVEALETLVKGRCCVSVQHNLGWRLHRSRHRGTAADCRHHSPSATAKTSIGLNNHNLEPPNCRLRCICPQSFLYLFQAWKKSI